MKNPMPSADQLEHAPTETKGDVIDLDEVVLRAQGHTAELYRSFSWLGALGLGFSIINSWLTYATNFGTAYSYGGGPTAVFGIIISAVVQWVVLLGVAELASAFPSSGGEYHFTYIIAPKATRSIAAYLVGMINLIAWWVNTASGTIYIAISAFGIGRFLNPDFAGTQWQVYLCYLGFIALTLLPIFLVPQRHIDNLTQTAMYLSILGLFLAIILCVAMSSGSYHPSNIVVPQASSGWSPGPAWLLTIGNGQYSFAAAGACIHIAEELPQPSRKIPLVMNLTMLVGILTALPWIIAMTCVVQDMEAVQASFLPSLEVFYQATGNRVAAAFLQAYLTMLYYTCVPSQWITSSRITWAFSRDGGLPFSKYWSKVDEKRNIPIRATLLSAAFCVVYGLLYIASTEAFNSILGTAVLMMNITYSIPQGILATAGRNRLPKRPFNLGIWGYPTNIFAVLWLVVSGVFFCFPTTRFPSLRDMNYNSVVICGIFILILICWVERRKKFSGPNIDWDALNAAQEAE